MEYIILYLYTQNKQNLIFAASKYFFYFIKNIKRTEDKKRRNKNKLWVQFN